jgi:hypothetical protein
MSIFPMLTDVQPGYFRRAMRAGPDYLFPLADRTRKFRLAGFSPGDLASVGKTNPTPLFRL